MSTTTYRAYLLVRNAKNPDKPTVQVVYAQAPKSGPLWKGVRALIAGEMDAAAELGVVGLFSDRACQTSVKALDGALLVASDDATERVGKLDKAALEAIIANKDLSPEQRLAQLAEQL